MLYFFVWSGNGGSRCATVRIQVPEARAPHGQNREGRRTAPEEMPALRRQRGASDHRSGNSVQRVGLVRYGLRREIPGGRKQREQARRGRQRRRQQGRCGERWRWKGIYRERVTGEGR